MSFVARQLGRPRGLLGRFVGRFLASGNAPFNMWLVQEIAELRSPDVRRIVEIGPGPGIAIQELLRTFAEAQIWGVDLSPEMLAQSRKRNLEHINSGRLILIEGDPSSLSRLAPLDLVLAAHVLYFWQRPAAELAQIRGALRPGGCLALGYQLRQNMPPGSQRNFLKEGFRLYESDDDVATLLREADFKNVSFVIKGPSEAPEGRLALATT